MSLDPSFWPADEDDQWIRHIIESGAVRAKEPRLKVQYLVNKFEVVDREWKAELSGRILSRALNIREKAEEAAASTKSPSIRFRELAYVAVQSVRKIPTFDVIVEPIDGDDAHANIVLRTLGTAPLLSGSVQKLSVEHLVELAKIFAVCDATDISAVEALRKPL